MRQSAETETSPNVKIERMAVISRVTVNGDPRQLWALELPWRDNKTDMSCIPPGAYTAIRHYSKTLKQWVWWLQDVPGRTFIYLHIANKPSELLGCLAMGLGLGLLSGEPAMVNSTAAMTRLLDIPHDTIEVTIQ